MLLCEDTRDGVPSDRTWGRAETPVAARGRAAIGSPRADSIIGQEPKMLQTRAGHTGAGLRFTVTWVGKKEP
jgi:hypothetical protein